MSTKRTLIDVLAGRADSLALIVTEGGPQLSRGQLDRASRDFAEQILSAGAGPGSVVSIAITNTAEYVVAFLGATYARSVSAPLNPAYKEDEFKFYMEDAGSKLLIVDQQGNAPAEQAAQSLNIPVLVVSLHQGPGSTFQCRLSLKHPSIGLPRLNPRLPGLALNPQPSDIGLFLHTSGTTSRPKGVPLTHANLVASLHNIAQTYELTEHDRSYLVMPLFHVHGLMAGLLAPLLSGSTIILPAGGKFSAQVFWKDCVQHRATFYTAVPTMHQVLLARADSDYPRHSPPPLRFIRSCSSSLAAATLEKLEAVFKVPVLEAYAMTEASHQMTSNPLPKHGPHKPGTVGKPQGGVSVAILDFNNKVLAAGEIGEVCIRGANVTKGYLNNPKANEEAFAGGWFHTGDQGWLDKEGYLTLTGRLKELINRGGEKISPLEVDNALLSHPAVAEAICFGAPDEKYGEIVAAAVVLKPGTATDKKVLEAEIKAVCAKKLAAFKVPVMVFFTDALPKGATGKIQRRNMAAAFIKTAPTPAPASAPAAAAASVGNDGYAAVANSLAKLGVTAIYGVIGIPVTQLASAAQAAGIRFISMRNEQAAGYAAAAAGYLTGRPGVLLTVSGPGAVHGIAGLSHAAVNCWPLIMISGSAVSSEMGKGSFQECDQVAAVKQFCKYAGRAHSVEDIPRVIAAAYLAANNGRPGATYVDVPADVLMSHLEGRLPLPPPAAGVPLRLGASSQAVAAAAALLRSAERPLLVVGKGAAQSQAEEELQHLVSSCGCPVLFTSMGRGLLPDSHPLVVNAARSQALRGADVALVVGARLNWQLHFGEAPRWADDVKFILADVEPGPRDASLAKVVLVGDARQVLTQLADDLTSGPAAVDPRRYEPWVGKLRGVAQAATKKLDVKLAPTAFPLDYYTVLRVIREKLAPLHPAPVVVSEGANTMDMSRLLLPAIAPRCRLDAGTWGTMGVGLGYAVAAAVSDPSRLVVACEGDSAFGFSGMEVETIARYKLPVVIIVFNNGGIYGGDRREEGLKRAALEGAARGGFGSDPVPTDFVPGCRYDTMMSALGGRGYNVATAADLSAACSSAFAARQPALINVVLDPLAGVESGTVHAFNAPKSAL